MANATDFQRIIPFYLGRPGKTTSVITIVGDMQASDTTFVFSAPLKDTDGNVITEAFEIGVLITDGDSKGYVENIYFDAASLDAAGTTATGAYRGRKPSGYDVDGSDRPAGDTSTYAVDIPDGSIVVIPHTAFQQELVNQAILGTIGSGLKLNGRITYTGNNALLAGRVFADTTARDAAITSPQNGDGPIYITGTGTIQYYIGGTWTNQGTSTTPNASETVTGKIQLNTSAQTDAATDTDGGDPTVNKPSEIARAIQDAKYTFAADAEASDTYAITLTPAPSAYATGQRFTFTANTANTGAATLNVNSLGAKTIKKHHDQDLEDGDIESGSVVEVVYDGTNMQMVSQTAATPLAATDVSRKIAQSTSDTTISDTTTETNLFSPVSIPAGTLGTGNVIRAKLWISTLGAGAGDTHTIRLKYGSTTIATAVYTAPDTKTGHVGYIEAELHAAGATGSQEGVLDLALFDTNAVEWRDIEQGTASEDSTGDLNFVITCQIGSADAARNITISRYLIEAIS